MLYPVPSNECVRAREAASGRLDGEISKLEAAWLEIHLRRCPACRGFAAQIAALAAELRRAPLEQPSATAFTPRSSRRASALRLQAVAAALAIAAVGGSFALGRALSPGPSVPALRAVAAEGDLGSARADSLEQRLLALLPPRAEPRPLRGTTTVAL
ncbi:MAG: zf-HC2 domain-containing protein [Rhodospirillales bacterium]|nr:zf-HC2 domain-containing protein [Rhodospirillales bacterium]